MIYLAPILIAVIIAICIGWWRTYSKLCQQNDLNEILKSENWTLRQSQKNGSDDDGEMGVFRISKRLKNKPTPLDYHALFEASHIGRSILNDLAERFGGATYVSGGMEADREQCYRAGRKSVLDFICIQLSRALEPETHNQIE
ncbi:hypothetical protein AWW72_13295 [Acinetobacter sp. NRRL B-65365]|uniref:Bbp19 family protein n=1 Tax=Acinetobacter sp. NRRL B-65365 TaxID=1785092 RepID=UPI0007A02B34|nr:hypothetical protein [Acinetobacter sp. NRRL B-65365]KYQ83558.1 hypothetical protein AWW72_13295 [Acinetobacter sp. NRRL B-65365]